MGDLARTLIESRVATLLRRVAGRDSSRHGGAGDCEHGRNHTIRKPVYPGDTIRVGSRSTKPQGAPPTVPQRRRVGSGGHHQNDEAVAVYTSLTLVKKTPDESSR